MKELILDYEDFQVWHENGHYFYKAKDEEDIIEVTPIAELRYTVLNDCLATAEELGSMFDNFCCGELVDDNEIYYIWFKQMEE